MTRSKQKQKQLARARAEQKPSSPAYVHRAAAAAPVPVATTRTGRAWNELLARHRRELLELAKLGAEEFPDGTHVRWLHRTQRLHLVGDKGQTVGDHPRQQIFWTGQVCGPHPQEPAVARVITPAGTIHLVPWQTLLRDDRLGPGRQMDLLAEDGVGSADQVRTA